jgi:hypothetical protein
MWSEFPDSFVDGTEGNNCATESTTCPCTYANAFGYTATEGFDTVYGLGSPNVKKIIEYLNLPYTISK